MAFIFSILKIQIIALLLVLEFVDKTLHENHENWCTTKFKQFTVFILKVKKNITESDVLSLCYIITN